MRCAPPSGSRVLIVIALVPLRLWLGRRLSALMRIALGLLALVPVVGIVQMGARRWLGAGGLQLQPSEIMKVALVLALARYYQWLAPERVSRPLWVAAAACY